MSLICVFVLAHAKSRFSHDPAYILLAYQGTYFCIDHFLEMDDSSFKRRAYQRILNINRCIVIDMPEIEIPWFMGDYVEEWKLNRQDTNSSSEYRKRS